jgi:hypothetical protein
MGNGRWAICNLQSAIGNSRILLWFSWRIDALDGKGWVEGRAGLGKGDGGIKLSGDLGVELRKLLVPRGCKRLGPSRDGYGAAIAGGNHSLAAP